MSTSQSLKANGGCGVRQSEQGTSAAGRHQRLAEEDSSYQAPAVVLHGRDSLITGAVRETIGAGEECATCRPGLLAADREARVVTEDRHDAPAVGGLDDRVRPAVLAEDAAVLARAHAAAVMV